MKPAEGRTILREVITTVSAWRDAGRQLRIEAATLDAYASAFEHQLMDEARRITGR